MGEFTQNILIPGYSRNKTEVGVVFAYRTVTFFGWLFQGHSANNPICNFLEYQIPLTPEAYPIFEIQCSNLITHEEPQKLGMNGNLGKAEEDFH